MGSSWQSTRSSSGHVCSWKNHHQHELRNWNRRQPKQSHRILFHYNLCTVLFMVHSRSFQNTHTHMHRYTIYTGILHVHAMPAHYSKAYCNFSKRETLSHTTLDCFDWRILCTYSWWSCVHTYYTHTHTHNTHTHVDTDIICMYSCVCLCMCVYEH